jgi:hypothetical protein
MSRFWAALFAVLAWTGTTAAQAQSTAPTTNAGTQLAFPAILGGAQLVRSVTNPSGQGHSYFYSTAKKMPIIVELYNGGRRVPPGMDNPTVIAEFANQVDADEQRAKFNGFTQFERPSVASTCVYGSVRFRCISFSASTPTNARLHSKVLMTGYRDHFVKIHIEWWPSRQQTAADAEAALQAFVPALMR